MDKRKDIFFTDRENFRAVIRNRLIFSDSLFLPLDDYRRLPYKVAAENRLFFDAASLSRERIYEISFHFRTLGLAVPFFIDGPDIISKSFSDVHYDFPQDYGTLTIAQDMSFSCGDFSGEGKNYLDMIAAACKCDKPVLLLGESGVGKDFIAKKIHDNSDFRSGPFFNRSAADWNPGLIETELFGCVRGAYSGAMNSAGAFEACRKGTFFLNEIALLDLDLQGKLLGVLGNRRFCRVGSSEEKRAECRYIFGTDEDLESLVKQGRFKKQLFYRISVIVIKIPPLRKRKDEIPVIAAVFAGREGKSLTDTAVQKLVRYEWPGNVRELENCIQRSCALAGKKDIVGEEDLVF